MSFLGVRNGVSIALQTIASLATGKPYPTLALDFVNSNSLPSSVTFSRGTAATQYDSTGALAYAPMNAIRNNTMVGTVAGTPGTLPTNWSTDASTTGLSRQIVGANVDGGINYVEIRIFGTSAAANYYLITFDGAAVIPALSGQQWTGSVYIKQVGGTAAGLTAMPAIAINENTSAGVYVIGGSGTAVTPSASWQRLTYTRTLSGGATVAYALPFLRMDIANGGVVDITLRIGMPQLELGSTATAVNATSGTAYYGPRFDYDPSSLVYQNLLTYSQQFDNAAWSKFNSTAAADSALSPDGTTTADSFIESSDSVASFHTISRTVTNLSAVAHTLSVYVKAGSRTYFDISLTSGVGVYFNLTTATITYTYGAGVSGTITSVGSGWYRLTATVVMPAGSSTITLVPGNTAGTTSYIGNGSVSAYIWGAQLNIGSTALPYYATTSAAYTQCAPRGLLIEEARTNSIRNNTMQGAVAGTPGTAPTNWTVDVSAVTGVSSQIVGTGTENGISYIDVRLFGTSSVAANALVLFDANNVTAAAPSQAWAASAYVKLQSGSLAGINSTFLEVYEYTSVPAYLRQTTVVTFTPTASGLESQRQSGIVTTGVSTAFTRASATIRFTSGVAVDITLRIGLPQLELGAFATSVIPTFGSTVTRNADVATINTLTPWFNSIEGTLYNEFMLEGVGAALSRASVSLGVSGIGNRGYASVFNDSVDTVSFNIYDDTPTYQGVPSPTPTVSANAVVKLAGAYRVNDSATSINATTPVTDTTVTLATALNVMQIGALTTGSSALNGWVRSIRYYPTRLPDSVLTGLTA